MPVSKLLISKLSVSKESISKELVSKELISKELISKLGLVMSISKRVKYEFSQVVKQDNDNNTFVPIFFCEKANC